MPTAFERLARLPAEIYQRVSRAALSAGILGGSSTAVGPNPSAALGGLSDYVIRDRMLDGTVYRRGYGLQEILRVLNKPCTTDDENKWSVPGYYNPVPQIVGFYESTTLYGQWDHELKPVKRKGEDVDQKLADLLGRLWRWSRLDVRKAELTTLAANQGTVGIRIVYDANGDDPRVYLDFDDPRWITRVDLDARGNCRTVVLEYALAAYDENGRPTTPKVVREVISAEGFSRQVDGQEQLSEAERANALGVCPYVLCRHRRRTGEVFGRHAYDGSERAIFGIDLGLSQLDESLQEHIWPRLFMTAAGPKPTTFKTGKYTLVYVQSREGVPPATLEAVSPNITVAETAEHFTQLDAWLREKNPAMILSALKLLSGVSGETLQQVLKPAESEALRARAEYEAALVQALQIALSLAIANRVPDFDLGTGVGTAEAAHKAYDDGQGPEYFTFKERPAIPPTVFQQLQMAQARVADQGAKLDLANKAKNTGVHSDNNVMRLAGMDDKQIAQNKREISQLDLPPDPVAGADFNGRRKPAPN
jgi:hypothetical protein